MNLMLLTVGGATLGGLMITMARDYRELRWWEYGLYVLIGTAIIYGITQMPYLGA